MIKLFIFKSSLTIFYALIIFVPEYRYFQTKLMNHSTEKNCAINFVPANFHCAKSLTTKRTDLFFKLHTSTAFSSPNQSLIQIRCYHLSNFFSLGSFQFISHLSFPLLYVTIPRSLNFSASFLSRLLYLFPLLPYFSLNSLKFLPSLISSLAHHKSMAMS